MSRVKWSLIHLCSGTSQKECGPWLEQRMGCYTEMPLTSWEHSTFLVSQLVILSVGLGLGTPCQGNPSLTCGNPFSYLVLFACWFLGSGADTGIGGLAVRLWSSQPCASH